MLPPDLTEATLALATIYPLSAGAIEARNNMKRLQREFETNRKQS